MTHDMAARFPGLGDALSRCADHLAVLVAGLEGVGDEELYEHAAAAYAAVAPLRAALSATHPEPRR